MIEIAKVKYEAILVLDDGKNMDITNIIDNLGWEENKGELAMRINFSMANITHDGTSISYVAKPGSLVGIIADWGVGKGEVARGTIVDWSTSSSNSKESLTITCYDDLYNLQQSQDDIYYSAGISTQSAIQGILDNWGIHLENYEGPNEVHAKLVYKSEALSDVILDILEDAEKKGADKCIIRSFQGMVSILPRGSNKTIYHFGEDSTIMTSNSLSTGSLITRVKIIGQEDDDGKSSVEAILDGKTEFGIRQKIIVRSQDDSISEAKKTAQQVLDEKGDIDKKITVESPDVPEVRKGDLVHVTAGTIQGYFYVEGIRHNASNCTMSMDLISSDEADVGKLEIDNSTEFNQGDTVILNGAVYRDSYGTGKGQTFTNRTCTITIKTELSRVCPYHVDGIGWVYPDTIKKE